MDKQQPTAAKKALYLVLVVMVILADQVSKWFITEMIFKPYVNMEGLSFFSWLKSIPEKLPSGIHIEVNSFYNMVMVWNQGVSFGMMNSLGDVGPIVLIALSLIIAGILLVWMMRSVDTAVGVTLALIIGGAIGNVIDRARFGAVIDFIDIHVKGHHWPAFNIADSAICVGVFFIVIQSLFSGKESQDNSIKPKKEV